MKRPKLTALADKAAPEWATVEHKGRTVQCRLRVKADRKTGELLHIYEWRLDGRPAREDRALTALI